MKLDLSKFFDEMLTYDDFSGEIDESEIDLKDRGAKLLAPIQYEGEIFKLDNGEYRVGIDIEYTYQEPCGRCLESAKYTKKTRLEGELFQGTEEDLPKEEDAALDNYIFYMDNKLDLSKYILGEVYLSMPIRIFCSDDCKGLCSICGINLNKDQCHCEEDFIDPRLAKLKDFFPEE